MKAFFGLSVVVIIVVVFRPWFLTPEIIGGDWPYYFTEVVKEKIFPPPVWVYWQNNGMGGIDPVRGLHAFESFLAVVGVQWLGLPWSVVYKIGWFGLFITLSIIGSKKLWEVVNYDSRESFPWWVLTSLIYTTNTYILMVTGGGQMGVALSYAIAPLVLASFIKLLRFSSFSDQNVKCQMSNVKCSLVAGLLLGFQVMIDPRIAYVTMIGVGIYFFLKLKAQSSKLKAASQSVKLFFLPFVIAVGINAFWVLPMVVMKNNPLESLGSTFTSIESIKFFSFADFSHAVSLLHPNWPENLFGKTYFLQPEFLVLPILAFGSLLFIKYQITNNKKQIIYFVFLELIGVFFTKGAQEPFGIIYQWMFTRIPGFVMFRDPTKFYLLIALSYSVLIPFTLAQLVELRIKRKTVLITLFILFWLFTIREATLGKLGGTFGRRTVPAEYVVLKGFLVTQPEFFRTLWVPRQSRFAFSSSLHPAVEAEPLFEATNAGMIADVFSNPKTRLLLEELSIRYIIVPSDTLGELFLDKRKYSEKKRESYIHVLDAVPWLMKIQNEPLAIFQASKHQ